MFHQISNDITADLGISPTDFQSVVNHAKTADVDIITVAQGATLIN